MATIVLLDSGAVVASMLAPPPASSTPGAPDVARRAAYARGESAATHRPAADPTHAGDGGRGATGRPLGRCPSGPARPEAPRASWRSRPGARRRGTCSRGSPPSANG